MSLASFGEVSQSVTAMLSTSNALDQRFASKYNELCWSIVSWVDSNCTNLDDITARIENANLSDIHKQQIKQLLDGGAALDIAGQHENVRRYIPMKVIMRFLYEKLLRSARWLPTMSPDQEKILNKVMDNIPVAYPERGVHFREIWRSNTYRSIAMNTELRQSSNQQLVETAEALVVVISAFVDDVATFDRPGLTELVVAAATLGHTMRLEPVSYSFLYPFAPQMLSEARTITKAALSNTRVEDMETGVWIRAYDCDSHESPGEILCTIFPSLMRLGDDGRVIKLSLGKAIAKASPELDLLGVHINEKSSVSSEGETT